MNTVQEKKKGLKKKEREHNTKQGEGGKEDKMILFCTDTSSVTFSTLRSRLEEKHSAK